MRADAFVNSGGFRPHWLPHYLSDYEFTLRMRRQGMRLMTDPSFRLEGDLQLTGTERYGGRGLRQFWSRTFSNRAKFNPIHWSAFIVLACPMWVVPIQLLRVWARFGIALAASLLATMPIAPKHPNRDQ
jgi:GT2 family glycosyltransferase